jgi:hypothetical protein
VSDSKKGWFSGIGTREDAEKTAKDCGNGFFAVAALQGLLGAFIAPSLILDAAVYAICGYFVRFKYSRVAAVVALILATIAGVTTVMNRMGQNVGGGNNIFVAAIVIFAGVRSVEATFKLRGRFKHAESR